MPMFYSFYMDLQGDDIAQTLLDKFDLEFDYANNQFSNENLYFSLMKYPEDGGLIGEYFSFYPTIYIVFHIRKGEWENEEEGRHTIIKVALSLLSKTKGDGVLLFNGELVVLQRRNQELVLNGDPRYGLWPDRRLAWINTPYQVRAIVSPLL